MHVLFNISARIGATFTSGAFVRFDSGSVAFCQKVGRGADAFSWVPVSIDVDVATFRTQQDVNSTAAMLGARVVGGVVSANVVGGKSSIGWKGERGEWTIADLIAAGKVSAKDVELCRQFNAPVVVETAAA